MKTKFPKKSKIVEPVLRKFETELRKYYGESLEAIILFGSYARGDFHADSDVDLLLLFPENTHINKETKKVMEIAYEFMLEDGYLLMPILTTHELFNKKNSPLYLNIKKEGIKI